MKILFDTALPFAWAWGGVTVLVKKLMRYLPEFGVEVEPVRWWDENQTGDVLSTFYLPDNITIYARKRNLKVVPYIFLDGLSSKGKPSLLLRREIIRLLKKISPNKACELGYSYPELSDAFIYPSEYDKRLGHYLFGAELSKSHVILHGVEDYYFDDGIEPEKSDYLISVSSIQERKNSLLLAKIAVEENIPVIFIGKPFSESDPYYREFLSVAHGKHIVYKGFVPEDEKLRYLKNARGFVLLSTAESGCIAALEALALKRPVFLSDLAWARCIYDGYAEFGDLCNFGKLKRQLKNFYARPSLPKPGFCISNWKEVSLKYLKVYRSVLENGN